MQEEKSFRALLQATSVQGREYEAILQAGDPRDELPRLAQESQACALVVGSHGKGAIRRALMGSCSSHLVTHCQVPVVVVRSQPNK
jgi:nucleotide-binding universal stress UspA family protein